MRLAENERAQLKAAIKRASKAARSAMNRYDAEVLAELETIYRRAAASLQADILAYAGEAGNLRLEVLQSLLRQTEAQLEQLRVARDALIDTGLAEAARLGAAAVVSARIDTPLVQIARDAAEWVRAFTDDKGLQLSDRLWRNHRQARDVVRQIITNAIVRGDDASRAATELLGAGRPVPEEVAKALGLSDAERVAQSLADALLTGEGSPMDNAMRLARTELNRAHGQAYEAGASRVEGAIGTRFLLSPRHPRPDICDLHASVNRYGLGPGVYPFGKNPLPAHPNTLSYKEIVFDDEVTEEDRAGKEDRTDWLLRQSRATQEHILGKNKADLLASGDLREGAINTPWRVLKKRQERTA